MNSDLSEEEIIEIVKEIKNHQIVFLDPKEHKQILRNYFSEKQRNAIQGLLDLYAEEKNENLVLSEDNVTLAIELQKEKEKNESLETTNNLLYKTNKDLIENTNVVSKNTLESYKKELEEIKKNLKSIHNTAFIDFGITLLDHILKGESK